MIGRLKLKVEIHAKFDLPRRVSSLWKLPHTLLILDTKTTGISSRQRLEHVQYFFVHVVGFCDNARGSSGTN